MCCSIAGSMACALPRHSSFIHGVVSGRLPACLPATSAAGGVLVAEGDIVNAQTRTQVTDDKASATLIGVAVDVSSRGDDGSYAGSDGCACTGSATECGR